MAEVHPDQPSLARDASNATIESLKQSVLKSVSDSNPKVPASSEQEGAQRSISENITVMMKSMAGAKEGDANIKGTASEKPATKAPSFGRLLQLSRPEWGALSRALFVALGSVGLDLLVPRVMGIIMDILIYPHFMIKEASIFDIVHFDISEDKRAEIRRFTFICLALRTASAALSIVKGITFGIVGARVVARMKVKLFGAMLVQDIGFFEAQSSGDLASRLGADAASVQMVATTGCPDLVIALIKLVVAFVFVFRLSWQLSLMVLGLLPLVTLYCLPFVFVFQRYNTRYQDTLAVASSVATQSIGNARTVRSFAAEDFTSTLYGTAIGDPDAPQACCWWPKRNQSTYHIGVVKGIISQTMIMGTISIATLGNLMITWYAYLMVVDSDITYGMMGAFLQYAVLIGMNVGALIRTFLSVVQAKGASQRVFEIIDRQPAIPIQGGERPSEVIGEIRFEDVTFAYPSRLEAQILKGLSFCVPAKSTAAFVGASGSGKSTVLLLLQRLYDVSGGKVLLDGRDISSLDVGWLRRHIGVVQQEPVLFGFSLRENICFGRTAAALCGDASFASEKEMVQASTEANAATFINSFPDGYDTLVGERGVRLSGGQKQRIAIARALICNPAVLLLDEATSALDSESEHLVQEAIERVMKDRTVLIVAHRLSTVINSDQIMVMSDAGLVDSGKHQELLKRCERYQQLVQRQILGEGSLETVREEEAANLTELTKSDSRLKRIVAKPEMEKLDAARLEALVMMNSVDEKSGQDKKDAVTDGPKPSVRGMFKPAQKEMPYLLFILIVSMVSIYAELEIPMLQGDLVDVVLNFMQTGEWRKEEVKRLMTTILLIQFATLMWGYARGMLQLVAGERIVSRLRLWCFKSIFSQEIAFFDTQTSGQLQARLGQDAQIVQVAVTSSMLEFVLGLLRAALGIARMLTVSWEITLMVFAIIPATGCILFLPLMIMKNLMVKLQDAGARASNIAVEATGNMRTVISFGSEEFIGAIFNVAIGDVDGPGVYCWWPKKSRSTYRYSCQVALVQRTSMVLAQWFGMCVLLVIAWYTYDLVIDGRLTIGDIQVITLYGVQIMMGTAGAGGPIALIGIAMGGAQRIFQIVNREPAFPNRGGSRPEALQGEVCFEDVSFSYPARPNQLILESLSFKVPTNSTAAFVGSSGCGKSTTLVLLQRFYEPTFGRVLIDGQDLRTLDAGWVRRRMSFVQQEPVLFGFSIRDNIAYGCHAARSAEGGPPATEDDIRKASEQANAHKFISDLPNGYDTLAGDRGALLSGGQKQRIAIARALLANPRILLLDEATSALDAESEHLVQEAIDRMMVNRTVLMIAHRLSTVQNAHQIMVMDTRKLIDTGTHEELLQRCEKYQELVKRQMGQSAPGALSCCEI